MKNIKFYSVISFLLLAVLIVGVNAYNGLADVVMENVNIDTYNRVESSDSLGATWTNQLKVDDDGNVLLSSQETLGGSQWTNLWQVDDNGNMLVAFDNNTMGIGTSSPIYPIEIATSTADGYFGITETTSGDVFVVDENGNVGINDNTPSYELDVNGDANITGTYRVNGSPISATANWTLSGDDVYYNTGNVGIGTDSPTSRLHVYSTTAGEEALFVKKSSDSTAAALKVEMTTSGGDRTILDVSNGSTIFGVYGDGRVGIGETTPTAKLDIAQSRTTSSDVIGLRVNSSNAGTGEGYSAIFETGNVGIGVTEPDEKLEVDGIILTTPTSSRTCDADAEGGIFYDSDDNHFYGCNGSSWVQLDN